MTDIKKHNSSRNLTGHSSSTQCAESLDASVADAIKRILDAQSSTNWLILSYERGVKLVKEGHGDFEECKQSLSDESVLYCYLRQPIGLDRRLKFVFIKWIGENVRAMQRARALEDCRSVQMHVKVYHLEISANKKSDLSEENLINRLQASAGANYDREQNANPGSAQSSSEFSSYKQSSKAFFQEKEKSTTLKNVVYETKALPKMTPVDLTGRPMTLGASISKSNVVDLKIQKDEQSVDQQQEQQQVQQHEQEQGRAGPAAEGWGRSPAAAAHQGAV